MAKRKQRSRIPQVKHKKKCRSSQFDKRQRLQNKNPHRKKTTQAKVPLVEPMLAFAGAMARALHAQSAFRLVIIMAGMMLANDRRVAAAWFSAAGVRDDWDRFYDCLISVGRKVSWLALPLVRAVVQKFDPGPEGHLTLGGDDSPTKRYGRHVEGAGVHHNPTAGPADGEWLYGHNWVSLCLLCRHPLWGVIALPLLSKLYVRAKDIAKLNDKYGWEFQTKHQLLVTLVTWFVEIVRALKMKCRIWLAVDGAYAAKSVLQPLVQQGVVVFSRLRKDAVLFDLPAEPKEKRRGRPRVYGQNRISLNKRAAHRQGWESITYLCCGVEVTRKYKSFLATSKLVGGVIRVVIVRFEDGGWAAYFCTEPQIEVRSILETVAARWAIEEQFHVVKEVWGAGQQQVRNLWSNIACWNLNQWMFTLVELVSWDVPQAELTDRSERPWDNPHRRPSHADKRRTIAKQMLRKQFFVYLPKRPELKKIRDSLADLINLCT
jgi:hypothetical protein